MSASYYLFLEAKLKGKWISLNPFFKEESKYLLSPLFVSGSRTYFQSTFDELRYLSISHKDSLPVSQEVKEWLYEEGICGEDKKEQYVNEALASALIIPYSQLVKKVMTKTERFDHTALIHKEDFNAMENGEEEEPDDYITDLEWYKELPKQAQDLYVLHSWDDVDGWRSHFKKIVKRVDFVISQYCNCFYAEASDFEEIRIIAFMFD